jgi:phage shock protein A
MQRAVKFGLAQPKLRTVTSLENQAKPALAKAEGKFAKKALKLGYALP